MSNKVIIIGGGLAGLTAAIHLRKLNIDVTLIERHAFPRQKVCGEYVSNEVVPYLKWLELDIQALKPKNITSLNFSTETGKSITTVLPLGGFGISRFTLDNYLYESALDRGCKVLIESVESIVYENHEFTIVTSAGRKLNAAIAIGAFGKRSTIDRQLKRTFLTKTAPWLAVKAHYRGVFKDNLVGLYTFKGGYCGVSMIEGDLLNICYLADYKSFKRYKNIVEYQDMVVTKNPCLKKVFLNASMVFDKPLTISQVSFERKKPIEDHILMIGDSAGLIHPLCGNGMAMAIHSAKIASELIEKYYNGQLKSRSQLEQKYIESWHKNFSKRLKTGKLLANVLQNQYLSNILMRMLFRFPGLLSFIVKKTHGKPILPNLNGPEYDIPNGSA